MIIRFNKYEILQYILLYICMLNTSSKASDMYGDKFIIATFVVSLIIIILHYVRIEKKPFLLIGGLCFVLFMQHVLLQSDISINSFLNLLSKFLISYCAVMIDRENFLKRFINLVIFIACCSLVFFFLIQIGADALVRNVLITNHAPCRTGNISYGRFLYHYMPNYGRNVGLYNEPGVYQLYLNLALFFLLFQSEKNNLNKKQTVRYSIVLVITIISAMSTAGYIGLFAIFALYLVSLKKTITLKKFVILISIIFLFLLFLQTDLFYQNFARKLEWSDDGRFSSGTGNARLASLIMDINYILHNPLGYGYSINWVNTLSFANNETGSSFGLTSLIVCYGIPISIFIYVLYFIAFINVGDSNIQRFTIIISFILAFSSQPWVLTPVYLTIMIYGLTKRKEVYPPYKNQF